MGEIKRYDFWHGETARNDTGEWVLYDAYESAISSMQATIAELTRERDELREASRWIPVAERLPEEEGIYPVYCKDTDTVFSVLFVEGEWCFWDVDGLQTFGNVTHWQPLPKAPL